MLAAHGDEVTIVGVAGRDELSAMEGFVSTHALEGMTHVADETGELWQRFGVISQPAWVFVNDDGAMEAYLGALGEENLSSVVASLRAA